MKDIPLGLFLMVLNNIGVSSTIFKKVQSALISYQISEPIFRVFVASAYYMKNMFTIFGTVKVPVFVVDQK